MSSPIETSVSRPSLTVQRSSNRQGPRPQGATGPVDQFQAQTDRDHVQVMADLRQARALHAASQRSYTYQPAAGPGIHANLARVNSANRWQVGDTAHLSGSQANDLVNQTYDHLDHQFQNYLPGPPVSNWMTYGKYASREAGNQIRNLEDMASAAHGSAQGLLNTACSMTDPDTLKQSTLVGCQAAGDEALHHQTPLGSAIPAVGAANVVGGSYNQLAGKMHGALVEGNTGIFSNMAPAFEAYLKGESKGGPGWRKALDQAGFQQGGPNDSQGFLHQGFQHYANAHDLGRAYEQATDPAEKQRLLHERDQEMNQGNLMFGIQEQMTILQKPSIFGDKQVQNLLGGVNGQMSFREAPGGTFPLLPDGKHNWTDFESRMGFKSSPTEQAGWIRIADPQGKVRWYAPNREGDPRSKNNLGETAAPPGTILNFFESRLNNESAQEMMRQSPTPLRAAPASITRLGLQNTAQGLDQHDLQKTWQGIQTTTAGVALDNLNTIQKAAGWLALPSLGLN